MSVLHEIMKHRPGMGSWQLGSDGTWSAMSKQEGIDCREKSYLGKRALVEGMGKWTGQGPKR